ncbi:MAG: hypothetical protein GF331_09430 [Chitinivibrionales bacterium]|nr:hypothetical protein [Chitinivibrionales bacterium]
MTGVDRFGGGMRRPAGDDDIVRESSPSDYDGHTEFGRLTMGERLDWLDAAVELWLDGWRARRKKAGYKA